MCGRRRAFDAQAIATQGRRRRTKRRVTGVGAIVAAAAIVVPLAVNQRHPPTPIARNSAPVGRTAHPGGTEPALPPPVRIKPLQSTGATIDGAPVLASVRAGSSVTIRARLSFFHDLPGRVRDAVLVLVPPGTMPEAPSTGYRATRLALSGHVSATSPQRRTLRLRVPDDLPAGTYPVLSAIQTGLLPGEQPGVRGPFSMSGDVGVVVVTAS